MKQKYLAEADFFSVPLALGNNEPAHSSGCLSVLEYKYSMYLSTYSIVYLRTICDLPLGA